ncbi:MAG: DUF3604 domain-containing protein, partial [Myxococcales bacterium]|nr:DUF3604 domain-containing protein [Myxococcales bacterium]
MITSFGCASESAPTSAREPCARRNPERDVFFGDLHVHTAYSFDAYINEVRVDPAAAYRFARGEPVLLPPVDGAGVGTQEVRIDRPLDFAAVTDHSEFLGEVDGCTTPGSGIYDQDLCVGLRSGDGGALAKLGLQLTADAPTRIDALCGQGGVDCPALAVDAWSRLRAAADAAQDRTEACSFTAFVGYEWSGARDLSNLHRNIIFRGSLVPPRPISYYDEPEPEGLWRRLQGECLKGLPGCDVLAIPHNSNWSNGNLFNPVYGADDVELAALQAAMEPLVEIYQHKGDSECAAGLSGILGEPDELCSFEKIRAQPYEDCGDGVGSGGMVANGCVSRRDFVRGALLAGLEVEAAIGTNPLRLGIIASTDTHNGTPGQVAEAAYPGHFGFREATPQDRLTAAVPGGPRNSPGGLVAVWAEENSREALFDAMRRRETYGTSGPRMVVRFFGG